MGETVFFVHGNRTNSRSAQKEGVRAFNNLGLQAPSGRPVRLVVWSWPSSATFHTIRRDAQIKSLRTDDEAFFLGSFLQRMNPEVSVTLVGFSFGARIITGSLHLLGGGSMKGLGLTGESSGKLPIRAVLLAAGVDSHWLAPGQRHGQALSQVDEMLITVNPRDFVLHHYPVLSERWNGGEALGYTGPTSDTYASPDANKVVEMNVNSLVQHRHFIANYLRSPEIMAMVRDEIDTHDLQITVIEPAGKEKPAP